MSEELIYQRGIAEVTQDIRRKTGEFLLTAIEIGRLLFEAKAMVEPGGWGKYIEEELPFSQSWANNYMKLYKEFGSDQTSLFGNSQTFLKLRPTQALELLALPPEDREAFIEGFFKIMTSTGAFTLTDLTETGLLSALELSKSLGRDKEVQRFALSFLSNTLADIRSKRITQ